MRTLTIVEVLAIVFIVLMLGWLIEGAVAQRHAFDEFESKCKLHNGAVVSTPYDHHPWECIDKRSII